MRMIDPMLSRTLLAKKPELCGPDQEGQVKLGETRKFDDIVAG